MTRPIKPSEVAEAKTKTIPDEVFEAFNELITENCSNGYAVVQQKDAVERIREKMPSVSIGQMFERGWLDVESAYRKAGWEVIYDKPGYNESYEPTFRFSKRS